MVLFLTLFAYFAFFLFVFSLGKKSKNLTAYTSWVLEPIRWIIIFFTTFLFIPILEILLSVFACVENNQGNQVHYIFAEIPCWKGTHLMIMIINCLTLIIFLLFTVVAVLLFFESSITSNSCNSKKNGVLNLLLLGIQFVFVIFETFVDNTIIQIFIFFLGSTLFFFQLRSNPPFLNEDISVIWLINSTFFIWTGIMLILSYVFILF